MIESSKSQKQIPNHQNWATSSGNDLWSIIRKNNNINKNRGSPQHKNHRNPTFSYEKSRIATSPIYENTTPDRFEALPGLLDHLNDEFEWL